MSVSSPLQIATCLVLWLGGCIATLCAQAPTVVTDTAIAREIEFIQGLRQRLLLDAADRWTERQQAQFADVPQALGDLLIERIKTQIARAMLAPATERGLAWSEAQKLGQEFLQRYPAQPRRLLVLTQMALARMAEAKQTSQEYLLNPENPAGQQQALDAFRTARSELETIQREATQALAAANSKTPSPDDLSPDELRSLMANLKYQVALTNLQRAELFPPADQANREDALLLVLKTLDAILASVDDSNDLWWSTRFSQMEAYRLLAQPSEAANILQGLAFDKMPANQAAELRRQQLELAAISPEPEKMLELIGQANQVPQSSPQLEIALMRYFMHLAKSDVATNDNLSWLDRAAALTRRIETRYGGYWGRQAERILVSGASQTGAAQLQSSSNPRQNWEVLVRVGDTALREQRVADATSAYQQASQMARTNATTPDQWRDVFQIQIKLAEISEQQKQYNAAAQILTETSRWQPDHPAASTLHLRAIWCLAQEAQQTPEARQRYRTALEQHGQWWPQADSVNQARIWRARLAMADSEITVAMENYLAIQPQSNQALTAAKEFGPACRAMIQTLDNPSAEARNQKIENLMSQIQLREQATGFRDARTDNWIRRYWLIHRLTLGLENRLIPLDSAWDQLETARKTSLEPADPEWSLTADAVSLAAKVLQGAAFESSQPELAAIESHLPALQLLWTILSSPANLANEQTRAARAWTVDRIVTRLPAAQQLRWQLLAVDLRLESKNWTEAETMAATLAEQHPQSLDVQLRLARAMQFQSSKLAAALGQWRKLAARAPEQTDAWFEAKYEVARLLLETGQAAQAKQMLEYMAAIPPGWTKSSRKEAFEALLKRCQQ